VQKSFNERDAFTGADGPKINYNALEFKDRPSQNDEEKKLIQDVSSWLETSGTELVSAALRSSIPGSNLVELPLGEDHGGIKEAFMEAHPKRLEGSFDSHRASLPPAAEAPEKAEAEVPQATPAQKPTKGRELNEEQKAALKAAGLDF
jgi:hypothetical protein